MTTDDAVDIGDDDGEQLRTTTTTIISDSRENTHPSSKNKKKRSGRHGARNERRHKNLTKWLVDTFAFLRDQSAAAAADGDAVTVLDVAGGKGELAARLTMCHGIQVIMVDPRLADVPHCFQTTVLTKLPNKWQDRIQQRLNDNPHFVKETIQSRFRQLVMCFDDRTVVEDAALRRAVQESSLLIGMHADSATETIVDVALAHRKPFVVVPCCVFPRLFPQRTLLVHDTPVPVRTHEQFCQYLANKHPNFQTETLPFEGRNVAIWWDGK